MSTAQLKEQLDGPYLISEWVSMADFRKYLVAVRAGDVSPLNGVTIQLRKATSSGGAGATNHGSAVTADDRAMAELNAEDLGQVGGVQYSHVQATVTDQDSPNTYTALAFRGDGRLMP